MFSEKIHHREHTKLMQTIEKQLFNAKTNHFSAQKVSKKLLNCRYFLISIPTFLPPREIPMIPSINHFIGTNNLIMKKAFLFACLIALIACNTTKPMQQFTTPIQSLNISKAQLLTVQKRTVLVVANTQVPDKVACYYVL
jgi:hypothetical protein